jgi:hypothetical protein
MLSTEALAIVITISRDSLERYSMTMVMCFSIPKRATDRTLTCRSSKMFMSREEFRESQYVRKLPKDRG